MTGHWRMTLAPVAVTVTTPLELTEAVDAAYTRGESVLYTLDAQPGLTPAGRSFAHVVHTADAGGPPRADFDAATATLRVHADASDLTAEDLLYLSYLVVEARLHLTAT